MAFYSMNFMTEYVHYRKLKISSKRKNKVSSTLFQQRYEQTWMSWCSLILTSAVLHMGGRVLNDRIASLETDTHTHYVHMYIHMCMYVFIWMYALHACTHACIWHIFLQGFLSSYLHIKHSRFITWA